MVAEETVRTDVQLGAYNCPACGSARRWDPEHHTLIGGKEPKIRVYCDCGMGILEIELVK